jgi:hypothetical protein
MNDSVPLLVALCKRASGTAAFVQRCHWEWRLSFFFLKKNLEFALDFVASWKNSTPIGVFQFFLRKKTEN